jgi:hypothetical protein
MKRKVIIPVPISQAIGALGVPRPVIVRLLTEIHTELAQDYEKFRSLRVSGGRNFSYRLVIQDALGRHYFDLAIDDTTSSDHLLIVGLKHSMK